MRPLQSVFSIGLGTQAVSPLDMARAYTSFADGGYRLDGSLLGNQPRTITTIRDGNGKTVADNRVVRRRVLTSDQSALLTQLLAGVVSGGTGTAAAIPGRAVAGKTGTTENYGDAWFVGYTPTLVTAVWVGYPDNLTPMLHEFHGGPVVGGSFPAEIWKTFTQSALDALQTPPTSFPSAPYLSGVAQRVTYRDGRIELDNGLCTDTSVIVYFTGRRPARTADCKRNEVDVPNLVGLALAKARTRLEAQPLTPELIWQPATAGQPVGTVLRQFPAGGTLSSYGHVTLVLAKPLHGRVPRLVGLPLRVARTRLAQQNLRPRVRFGTGKAGLVLAQEPLAGVAAAPGMTVRLVVARGG